MFLQELLKINEDNKSKDEDDMVWADEYDISKHPDYDARRPDRKLNMKDHPDYHPDNKGKLV